MTLPFVGSTSLPVVGAIAVLLSLTGLWERLVGEYLKRGTAEVAWVVRGAGTDEFSLAWQSLPRTDP